MDFITFLSDIQWIRALDCEPVIYAKNSAVYVDFYARVADVADHPDRHVATDLMLVGQWTAWDEVDSDVLDRLSQSKDLQHFRWIVTVD